MWDDKTRGEGLKVDNGETYAVNVSEMNRSLSRFHATCHSASSATELRTVKDNQEVRDVRDRMDDY